MVILIKFYDPYFQNYLSHNLLNISLLLKNNSQKLILLIGKKMYLGKMEFQQKVKNYGLTCCNIRHFESLSYVLTSDLLITPLINAAAKRIFSLVTTKKKWRKKNNEIEFTFCYYQNEGELLLSVKCCEEFSVTDKIREAFTNDKLDGKGSAGSRTSNEDESYELDLALLW